MSWVDSHCHLQLDGRPSQELLDRASEVDWVVVPGVDAVSSRAAITLAEEHPGRVLATAGLHPHDAEDWPAQRDEISGLAGKVAAIGETGLDFYRDLAPRDVQEACFREQIDLSLENAKPLIVHCRDAFADVHRIIEETGAGPHAVLHCWTGGRRWTRRFLDLGVTFSFAGPLAYETGETIRLGAELVPPERALVETDTPYLTPPPHRGEPNEPARVALVGAALARVWGMEVGEAARVTSANAARVFGR
ncbi:MAG TPA: TatD family hydrolase [Acidimicrobiia bacterium]|jgi:TatD DNase family protein|nr:TatD family hydrolase [Acidimicrobiia bacterium]